MRELGGITDAASQRGLSLAHLAALGQMSERVASLNSRLIEEIERNKLFLTQPQARHFFDRRKT